MAKGHPQILKRMCQVLDREEARLRLVIFELEEDMAQVRVRLEGIRIREFVLNWCSSDG